MKVLGFVVTFTFLSDIGRSSPTVLNMYSVGRLILVLFVNTFRHSTRCEKCKSKISSLRRI